MKSQILKRGYVLLFAVLTSALVLGVAAFIVSMARKQFILSAIARESIVSYYNADTVQNCIYKSWVFDQSSATSTIADIKCNGTNITVINNFSVEDGVIPSGSIAYGTDLFTYSQVYHAYGVVKFNSGASCTTFDIWRGPTNRTEADGHTLKPYMDSLMTVIEARGYNLCTGNGPTQSSRTIERAVRVTIPI